MGSFGTEYCAPIVPAHTVVSPVIGPGWLGGMMGMMLKVAGRVLCPQKSVTPKTSIIPGTLPIVTSMELVVLAAELQPFPVGTTQL